MDKHTCEVTIYFMAKKSDMFKAYKMFEVWVSVHWNAKIKILCTDCSGEFVSKAFQKHLDKNGTVCKLTVHHSPSQNSVLEHLNKTLILHSRTCLIETDLPGYLWAEAFQYTVWTKNRTPTCTLKNKTPLEMVTGIKLTQHSSLTMTLSQKGIACTGLTNTQLAWSGMSSGWTVVPHSLRGRNLPLSRPCRVLVCST